MSSRLEPPNEPLAKRQKLQPEIQRSPDFWFKKGDFVLVASQKVAYRLHGDVLGRKSKVFNDLLDLSEVPRPDCEDTMDGCPVVHITDSPEDFSAFLCLIYDSFEYQRLYAEQPRWASVRIMTLFGDKYDVPDIREEGLKQLRAWYAEDISEWDGRDEEFFAHEADHLSVASITHTLDEPSLHSAVLYHCCRLLVSQLVAGDPATGCPPLCTDDLVRTLTFVKSMPRTWLEFPSFIGHDTLGHYRPEECDECGEDDVTLGSMIADHLRSNLVSDAYRFLDHAAWIPLLNEIEKVMCNDCLSNYSLDLRDLREAYRANLERYFG